MIRLTFSNCCDVTSIYVCLSLSLSLSLSLFLSLSLWRKEIDQTLSVTARMKIWHCTDKHSLPSYEKEKSDQVYCFSWAYVQKHTISKIHPFPSRLSAKASIGINPRLRLAFYTASAFPLLRNAPARAFNVYVTKGISMTTISRTCLGQKRIRVWCRGTHAADKMRTHRQTVVLYGYTVQQEIFVRNLISSLSSKQFFD